MAAREKTKAKVARKGDTEMSVLRAVCWPGGEQASASALQALPEEGSIGALVAEEVRDRGGAPVLDLLGHYGYTDACCVCAGCTIPVDEL